MSSVSADRGFGIYVHWPYCARICPYCDFNVYAAKTRDTAPLFEAILRDLEGWRVRTGARKVRSIFLGGGTPSLMSGRQVDRLIRHVGALWDLAAEAEITLEANPDDAGRFADFSAAGVNRLSLGVQSLDTARLAFLGRTHSAGDARAAFAAAKACFASVSMDMIYATPGQSPVSWREELASALDMGADHLSLYELSIEPGAAFVHAVRRGDWAPPDDDLAADLYEMTQDLTTQAGLPAYEISNHARSAAHRSVHNSLYWGSGDWVGVGPGAHGRLSAEGERCASEALSAPAAYIRQVALTGVGFASAERLDPLAQARERIAMGLRPVGGFAMSDIEELGLSLNAERLADLAALGFLTESEGRIALSPSGRLRADRIAAEISP